MRRALRFLAVAACCRVLVPAGPRSARRSPRQKTRIGSTAPVPAANEALPPDASTRSAHAAQFAFDPAPYWRRVTVPALFMFADNDRYVKTSLNAPRAEQLMREAHNRDVQVVVLKHADHAFIDSETGLPSEQQRENRFAAGFIEGLTGWAQAHHLTPTH